MVRERDALRRRVPELEERLDHERLFPLEWANRRVRDRFGEVVVSGPFAGMRYPDWGLTRVDLFAPKLLGIYERELHPSVERLIARSPAVVANVGAADGYYTVGLARRIPEARVIAFETNEERVSQLIAIADLNGVSDRVEARVAPCDHDALAALLDDRTAIVCDCDGCEAHLLDPRQVPALREAAMLVETHDLIAEGTSRKLTEAFNASHEIARVDAEARFVDDFPELEFMPLVTRQLAISEFRQGPMWWLEMLPSPGRA